jgi:chromate reductase, NAD(P)H dehydrogenase (quinone)
MNILMFAASLRKESVNKKLIGLSQNLLHQQKIDTLLLDFKELNLPLYDGDVETTSGLPLPALKLIDHLKQTQALIISSPEYNFSIPGTLKNLIDWISRATPQPLKNIPTLLLSASPSLTGGHRGLLHTQVAFTSCLSLVFPEMFCLGNAYEAFDVKGNLKDQSLQNRLQNTLKHFINFVTAVTPLRK